MNPQTIPIYRDGGFHTRFQTFVGFDGTDVLPLTVVYDDPPDRSRFFHDLSDKGGNDGFDFAGFKRLEDRCLHSIDAGKEADLNSRVSQGVPQDVPKIADLTSLIDVHIQKRAAASQCKRYLRSLL